MKPRSELDDIKIHVKIKIAILWVAATLCYIYGDIIGLYTSGAIQSMLDGKMGFWGPAIPQSQGILLFIAVVISIPCIMVFLSLVLSSAISRWLNIIVGSIFTLIALVMLPAGAIDLYFFAFYSIVEAILTGLIVWYAVKWPGQQVYA